MTEFTNSYFQKMHEAIDGYFISRPSRIERAILIEEGDEEGLKDWNERDKNFPFPFSNGYMRAFHVWEHNTEHPAGIFVLDRLFYEDDAHDFIVCLKEAGISEFAITDMEEGLEDLIKVFETEGYTMKGQCEVKYSDRRRKAKKGLLMSL